MVVGRAVDGARLEVLLSLNQNRAGRDTCRERVCEASFCCFSKMNYGQVLLTLLGLYGYKMKVIT